MVPVTTRLLSPQKSTSLSPLSFLSPTPSIPLLQNHIRIFYTLISFVSVSRGHCTQFHFGDKDVLNNCEAKILI